jgi:hypothetical protein
MAKAGINTVTASVLKFHGQDGKGQVSKDLRISPKKRGREVMASRPQHSNTICCVKWQCFTSWLRQASATGNSAH